MREKEIFQQETMKDNGQPVKFELFFIEIK